MYKFTHGNPTLTSLGKTPPLYLFNVLKNVKTMLKNINHADTQIKLPGRRFTQQ